MLLAFAAALLAFLVSAVSGGGAGLLLLPVLARLLPGAGAPAALTIGTATSSVSKLVVFCTRVRWSVTRRFVPAAVPGVLLGGVLLRYLQPAWLDLALGAFLVGNVVFRVRRNGAMGGEATGISTRRIVLVGVAAGFVSGLTGAVGVLFNRVYFDCGLRRDEVVATRAANEILLHLLKLGVYATFGLLDRSVLVVGAAVAAGALAATLVTRHVLAWISEGVFRRVGYAAMVVSGVLLLGSATSRLGVTSQVVVEDGEVAVRGRWRGAQATVELAWDEGVVLEVPARLEELGAADRETLDVLAAGRAVIALEEVFAPSGRSYEADVVDGGGKIVTVEFAAARITAPSSSPPARRAPPG